jgi:ABC-type dipeptide/oligopeptide/nickel transport system permease component
MIKFISKKLLHLFFILIAVSAITFFMMDLLPGDAAYQLAGPEASLEDIEQIRKDLGLDKHIAVLSPDGVCNPVRMFM